MNSLQLFSLPTDLIRPNDNIFLHLEKALQQQKLSLQEGDIIAVSSKILSVSENQTYAFSKYSPSKKAHQYSKETHLSLEFCQAVIEESDSILGTCPGALLTINKNILIANAGIDKSNAPQGSLIIWPKDPQKSAQKLRTEIQNTHNINHIGIIVTDSHCLPMRQGTNGFALAISGFQGIIDERGKKDLYGNTYNITTRNIADGLACSANLLMGDTTEKVPLVLIRGAEVKFGEETGVLEINREDDIYRELLN